MRYSLPAVLALLTAGCIFGNSDRVDVSVTYTQSTADSLGSEPDFVRAGNLVTITHYFATPSPCYGFQSSAEQSKTLVELVIRQTFEGLPGCPDSVTTWHYNAVLVGVEAEAQRIGINYQQNGTPNRTEYQLP